MPDHFCVGAACPSHTRTNTGVVVSVQLVAITNAATSVAAGGVGAVECPSGACAQVLTACTFINVCTTQTKVNST